MYISSKYEIFIIAMLALCEHDALLHSTWRRPIRRLRRIRMKMDMDASKIDEARAIALSEDRDWFMKFIESADDSDTEEVFDLNTILSDDPAYVDGQESNGNSDPLKSDILQADSNQRENVDDSNFEKADLIALKRDDPAYTDTYESNRNSNQPESAIFLTSPNPSKDTDEPKDIDSSNYYGADVDSQRISDDKETINKSLEEKDMEILINLGYSESDALSLTEDIILLIIERQIKCPSDGIPEDWTSPSAKNLESKFNTTKSKSISREGGFSIDDPELVPNRSKFAKNQDTSGDIRDGFHDELEEYDSDDYEYEDENVNSESTSVRNREKVGEGLISMEKFKRMLRKESLMRLKIVGPAFTDAIAAENKFRINAYQEWLNFLADDDDDSNELEEDLYDEESQTRRNSISKSQSETRNRDLPYSSDEDDYDNDQIGIGENVMFFLNSGIQAIQNSLSELEENRIASAEAWENEKNGKVEKGNGGARNKSNQFKTMREQLFYSVEDDDESDSEIPKQSEHPKVLLKKRGREKRNLSSRERKTLDYDDESNWQSDRPEHQRNLSNMKRDREMLSSSAKEMKTLDLYDDDGKSDWETAGQSERQQNLPKKREREKLNFSFKARKTSNLNDDNYKSDLKAADQSERPKNLLTKRDRTERLDNSFDESD